MIFVAVVCLIAVVAVGLRALPRPAAEMVVDALYRAAQTAYATACAADTGLLRYRTVRAEIAAGHRPQYQEGV